MKKIVTSVLVLIIMFAAASSMAEEMVSIIGDWYLTSIDDVAITETETGMIIGADGDAVLSYNGNVKEVKWRREDDSIVFYDDDEDLMYVNIGDDGTLWIESEGSKLIFSQTQNEATYETVETATDVEALDFIGNWAPRSIIAYGTEYDAAEFSFTTQISIADGEATVMTDEEEAMFTTRFENGILYIGDDDSNLQCSLRDDDCMIFDLEEDGMIVTIVMEKV